MHCCLEYIFISDSVFECEWATNLFRWKLVDRWIRRGGLLRLDKLREENASTQEATGSMNDSKRT